jgi:hypothetical protein
MAEELASPLVAVKMKNIKRDYVTVPALKAIMESEWLASKCVQKRSPIAAA